MIALFLGLFRVRRDTKKQDCVPVFVSVIVAARNEEEHLSDCLESLLNQTYPKELYEIILVDDRSTDSTPDIARSFAERDKRIELMKTTTHRSLIGKQHALDTGIRASRGEIILVTDADCEIPSEWIRNTIQEYEDDVGLVAGFALFKEKGLDKGIWQKAALELQSLELLSLYAVSIGSMALGDAWTCTGNNLTFRREVYDDLGGFEALDSIHEDSMMVQWVDRHSKWRVKPMLNLVYTRPNKTLSQFCSQRVRWVSRSSQFRPSAVFFSVVTYGVNLLLPILIGLCVFEVISYEGLILFLGLKIVSEFLIIRKVLTLFHRTKLMKYFLPAQFFHVIYVLVFGVYGLSGKCTWKGTKYMQGKAQGDYVA